MERYKIEIDDFGKQGDLEKGYGYIIYLNEKEGYKSFPQKIFIYEFDSHILIASGEKEDRNFPIGIEPKENIEKAEKRAHAIATKDVANNLGIFISSSKKRFQIIDKTRLGKSLAEKLK